MNSSVIDTNADRIGMEACEWLLRLQEDSAGGDQRNRAFFLWLGTSVAHLRAFMETFEAYQLLGTLNAKRSEEIRQMMQTRVEVIQLYGKRPSAVAPSDNHSTNHSTVRHRVLATAVAVLLVVAGLIAWNAYGFKSYATTVGEQRIFNLDDGSVVVLNTNSRMKVDFSDRERSIKLLQGEALFTVEHDAHRPFVVSVGAASIRAIGTQFNVRCRRDGTEVSVVEGVVQVDPKGSGSGAPQVLQAGRVLLVAGEQAHVAMGKVAKQAKPDVANTLSWRAGRLVFTDASFEEVAAEFNRYNRAQVRVEGAAGRKRLTGIFDADHPRAFVLYAARDRSLQVATVGNDWVIRDFIEH